MKSIYRLSILLILLALIINCEKTVYYHDRTEPEFSYDPNYSVLTDNSATIIWSTDEACKSKLIYSFYENNDYQDSIVFDEFRQKQTVNLNNLWPNVRYYCVVEITDFAENDPVFSDTLLFRTLTNEVSAAWDQINSNHLDNAATILGNSTNTSREMMFTKAWLEFRKGNIEIAQESMNTIFENYPGFIPNLAGLVVINHLLQEYNAAISYGNKLLNLNQYWSFVYTRSDLNYKYVRLMMADAYLSTGLIEYAQDQLDIVFPDNNLEPDLPGSWKVDGVYYENYESAMIAFINYLYMVL